MSNDLKFDWDPRSETVLSDQRATYDDMRHRCPVARSEFLGWSIFRHDDIKTVLEQPETFSSTSRHRAVPNGMDEPDHTPYRESLDPSLDQGAVGGFESTCRQLAVEAVSNIVQRESVDMVEAFTEPFAMKSLCAFLGWPMETWHYLRGWAHDNQHVAFSRDRAVSKSLAEGFADVASREFAIRRTEASGAPADLTAWLVRVEVAGNPLTEEDLVSIVRNWAAGHGTVAAGLGLVIKYLAEN